MKEVGDWKVLYNYREVEKDATLGALFDSDFAGGQLDAKGHVFAIAYGIFKNSDIALTYFDVQRDISSTETDYTRLHVDISFKYEANGKRGRK